MSGVGEMNGSAWFTWLDEETLQYREEGELRLFSGSSHLAYRELFYSLDTNRIVVRLRLGSDPQHLLFQLALEPSGPTPWPASSSAIHICGQDTYEGGYVFETRHQFRTTVKVNGPSKNYTIASCFTRALD